MLTIKNGDLQANLGTVSAFWRVEDPIHRRLRTPAMSEKSERLMQHTAKTLQFGHHLTQFRIFTDRQVPRILKGGVKVQLKPNVNHAT
jgi:hypothetical protein